MKQDIVIRHFLSKYKSAGDPFIVIETKLKNGTIDPLMMKCKRRFEEVRWLFEVSKMKGNDFRPYAIMDLMKFGYIKVKTFLDGTPEGTYVSREIHG